MRAVLVANGSGVEPLLSLLLCAALADGRLSANAAVKAISHACQQPHSLAARLAARGDVVDVMLALVQPAGMGGAGNRVGEREAEKCEAAVACVANLSFFASQQGLCTLLEPSRGERGERAPGLSAAGLCRLIPSLVRHLQSECCQIQAHAAVALCNISAAGCRDAVVESGALEVLQFVADSAQPEARQASARALEVVSKDLTPNSRRVVLRRSGSGRRPRPGSARSPLAGGGNWSLTTRADGSSSGLLAKGAGGSRNAKPFRSPLTWPVGGLEAE